MNSDFYSKSELQSLQNRGVKIPSIDLIAIDRSVPLDAISEGVVLHPFSKLIGSQTKLYPRASVGNGGSVVVENTVVGSDAILGSLGPVTVRDSWIGPRSVLGAGVAEQSVFLGRESTDSGFSTGFGFRCRKGSLYEEDASSAQHTDTKMSILFPWVTLGSNINLCDLLLSGGTGLGLGDFTEVGSGTIHFNFTLRGDKATASLFGSTMDGVFLQEDRLFIGGNNSLIGPLTAEFGAMTAAGIRVTGKLRKGLSLGQGEIKGHIDYIPSYHHAQQIVASQIHYIGQLIALYQWYECVRIPLVQTDFERQELYRAGQRVVDWNIQERIQQLDFFILQALRTQEKRSSPMLSDVFATWSSQKTFLQGHANSRQVCPPMFQEALFASACVHTHYTKIIQSLLPETVLLGKRWMQSIAAC